MYKLIIVDDEVETRNDLADLINMQDTGFEIAGLFNDGLPVKKYLEKNKVDVIITDIKMPCTNGLDLSEYIYHHYPEIVIIIISGYGEFEYARRSMEYNIKQYLLKPVDFDEMIAVLAKTKEELDEEYRKRKFYQEWEHEKQSEFLRKLYLGLYQDEQQIEKEFEKVYFSFDISSSKGRVIKIVFENYNEFIKGFWKHGKERIFVAIKNIIDEVYENQDSYILFQSADGIIVIILKSDEHDKKLINFIREIIGIKIDIREILKFNSILDLSDGLLGENEVAEVVTRIITNMVSMNIHDAQKDLKNCINKICRKDNLEELLSILKDKLLAAISIYWNTVGIKNVSIFEMADHLDKYINDLNRPEAEYNDIIIERSKDYIMKNYNRDISISDVSKNVYLSAEYFGRYFKKATGQSVGSFLVEIRMNKAIEYLAENKTVKEISESVGYMDYRYFLRVFKKYTECSPKEYRKKYLRNDQN